MRDTGRDEREMGDAEPSFVCRCEEILLEEVVAAITDGAQTVDDIKRRTRVGMGICQGIFCVPVIAALVAQATGVPVARVAGITARPPARPVMLEALADLRVVVADEDGSPVSEEE